jgi:hypothetical protein
VNPPGESRKTARLWIILGVVLFVLVIAGGAGLYFGGKHLGKAISAQKERRARLADLESKRRELSEAAKTAAEEGTVDGMADRLAKFGDSVGNAAESATGAERQSLRVAQRVLQSMTPALSSYEAAFKELESAGFAQPETLQSRDAIASRVVVVNKFGEANDNLTKVLNGIEARVRTEMESENVPVRSREQFVTGFMKSANLELNRVIRRCDSELVTTLLKMLAVLDREWGQWKSEDGNVIFNRPPVIEEYNKLVAELQDIAARQSVAQQELLKRTSKPAPLR